MPSSEMWTLSPGPSVRWWDEPGAPIVSQGPWVSEAYDSPDSQLKQTSLSPWPLLNPTDSIHSTKHELTIGNYETRTEKPLGIKGKTAALDFS